MSVRHMSTSGSRSCFAALGLTLIAGSVLAQEAAPQPAAAEGAPAAAPGTPGATPTAAPPAPTEEAAPLDPKEAEIKRKLDELQASLKFQNGTVAVGDGVAKLALTPDFTFIDGKDAEKVLQAWGNPPSDETLGMIFPASMGPFEKESWAVIVTYDDEGHVDDKEADSLEYDEMLKDMQAATKEANEERKKEGYSPVQLLGWAEPPHYDKTTKKLYWAKELDFGEGEHTLNYAVRVLGRKGVLQLNAVASMSQLGMIKGDMTKIIPMVEFNAGHRYFDFDPKVDKAAAYGLGALIAGGVAAKAGLFKGLIALLIAGKKLVVLAIAGGAAALKRFLGRNKTA